MTTERKQIIATRFVNFVDIKVKTEFIAIMVYDEESMEAPTRVDYALRVVAQDKKGLDLLHTETYYRVNPISVAQEWSDNQNKLADISEKMNKLSITEQDIIDTKIPRSDLER